MARYLGYIIYDNSICFGMGTEQEVIKKLNNMPGVYMLAKLVDFMI